VGIDRPPAVHGNSFVRAGGDVRIRFRRVGDVEVNIVGDEEIEMPIAVVVKKGAPGTEADFRMQESRV